MPDIQNYERAARGRALSLRVYFYPDDLGTPRAAEPTGTRVETWGRWYRQSVSEELTQNLISRSKEDYILECRWDARVRVGIVIGVAGVGSRIKSLEFIGRRKWVRVQLDEDFFGSQSWAPA